MSSRAEAAAPAATPAVADTAPPPPESFLEALSKASKDDQPKSVLWIVSLLLSLFALGAHDLLTNHEDNGCAMTYMYELPLYLPVPDPDTVEKRFSQYRLFAYAEGEDYARTVSAGDFFGIPVLFIPGNSGSYKQVRSLASVALRKAYEDDVAGRFHFDYFAIDFNEEFSALYGGSLEAQAEFAALSVNRILKLYEQGKNSPKSVVLVGHSIGGLVARAVFLSPKFDAAKVNTIITLATPHQPVVVLDSYTRAFYDGVDRLWNLTRATTLKDIVFVSISGGERDIQVRSGLAVSPHADVNVATTDAPAVWVSTDHQCIAWCKQLVIAVNRALFDTVHKDTNQVTSNTEHRRKAFRYHFVQRSAGNRYKTKNMFLKTMEFDKDGFWSDSLKRQFVFMRESVAQDSHIMIRIFDDPKHQSVTIDVLNFDHDNWLFGCKATTVHLNTRICESGDNLSHRTRIIPSNGKRKSVRMNLHELGDKHNYTHLLVYIPKKSEHIKVNIDVYNERERNFAYEVPRFISFWKSHIIVQQTLPTSVFYNISLQGMESPWQAYDVKVSAINKCDDANHFGIMRFVTPWVHDTTQALLGFNMTNKLTARLQTPKPEDGRYYRNPEMLIHLNPSCQYRIEIQSSINQMWGQMVRFYAPMLLPLCVATVLLTVAQQLKLLHTEGNFPSFNSVIANRVSPISVVMPSRILSSIVSMGFIAKLVPINDLQRIADQGIDFGILPIALFFISIGIMTIISAAAWFCVAVFGTIASKTFMKLLPRSNIGSNVIHDGSVGGPAKFPFILSGLLIALGSATCGTLALCLGTFCHFLQICCLYQDYIKAQVITKTELEKKKEDGLSPANFQFSMLLLWASAAVLNAPALLAWTRNLSFVPNLQPDPSLLVSVVLSASLAMTFGNRAPKRDLLLYDRLSMLIQFLCVLMVLYGSVSVYRINYFLSAAFVAIVLHQIFAPEKSVEEATSSEENNKLSKDVSCKEETMVSRKNDSDRNESSALSRHASNVLQIFLIMSFNFEAALYVSIRVVANFVGIISLTIFKFSFGDHFSTWTKGETSEQTGTEYDFEHHLPDIVRRSRQQAVALNPRSDVSVRYARLNLFSGTFSLLKRCLAITYTLSAFRCISDFVIKFMNNLSMTLEKSLGFIWFVVTTIPRRIVMFRLNNWVQDSSEAKRPKTTNVQVESENKIFVKGFQNPLKSNLLQDFEEVHPRQHVLETPTQSITPLSEEQYEQTVREDTTMNVVPNTGGRGRLWQCFGKLSVRESSIRFIVGFSKDVIRSILTAAFFLKSYFIHPYPYLVIEWLRNKTFSNAEGLNIAQSREQKLNDSSEKKEEYLPKMESRVYSFLQSSTKAQPKLKVATDTVKASYEFILNFVMNVQCAVVTSVVSVKSYFFHPYPYFIFKFLKTRVLGTVQVPENTTARSEKTRIQCEKADQKQFQLTDSNISNSVKSSKEPSTLKNIATDFINSSFTFILNFVWDLNCSLVTSISFLKVCFIHPYPYYATMSLKKFILEGNWKFYFKFKSLVLATCQRLYEYSSMFLIGFLNDLKSSIMYSVLSVKHHLLLPFNAPILQQLRSCCNLQLLKGIPNLIRKEDLAPKSAEEKEKRTICAGALKMPVCFAYDLYKAISVALKSLLHYFVHPTPYLLLLRLVEMTNVLPSERRVFLAEPSKEVEPVIHSDGFELRQESKLSRLPITAGGVTAYESSPALGTTVPQEILREDSMAGRNIAYSTLPTSFHLKRFFDRVMLSHMSNFKLILHPSAACRECAKLLSSSSGNAAHFVIRFGKDVYSVITYVKDFIIYYLFSLYSSSLLQYCKDQLKRSNCAPVRYAAVKTLKTACYISIRTWEGAKTLRQFIRNAYLKTGTAETDFEDSTNSKTDDAEHELTPTMHDLRHISDQQKGVDDRSSSLDLAANGQGSKLHKSSDKEFEEKLASPGDKEGLKTLKLNSPQEDVTVANWDSTYATSIDNNIIESESKTTLPSQDELEVVDKHITMAQKRLDDDKATECNTNNKNFSKPEAAGQTFQLILNEANESENTLDEIEYEETTNVHKLEQQITNFNKLIKSIPYDDSNQDTSNEISCLNDLVKQGQEREPIVDLDKLLELLNSIKLDDTVVSAKQFIRELNVDKQIGNNLPRELHRSSVTAGDPTLQKESQEIHIEERKSSDISEIFTLIKKFVTCRSERSSNDATEKECLSREIEDNVNFKVLTDLLLDANLLKPDDTPGMDTFKIITGRVDSRSLSDNAADREYESRHDCNFPANQRTECEQSRETLKSGRSDILHYKADNESHFLQELKAVEEELCVAEHIFHANGARSKIKQAEDKMGEYFHHPVMIGECEFEVADEWENAEADEEESDNCGVLEEDYHGTRTARTAQGSHAKSRTGKDAAREEAEEAYEEELNEEQFAIESDNKSTARYNDRCDDSNKEEQLNTDNKTPVKLARSTSEVGDVQAWLEDDVISKHSIAKKSPKWAMLANEVIDEQLVSAQDEDVIGQQPETIQGDIPDGHCCVIEAASTKPQTNASRHRAIHSNEDMTCLEKLAYQTLVLDNELEAVPVEVEGTTSTYSPNFSEKYGTEKSAVEILSAEPERPKRMKKSFETQKMEKANLFEPKNDSQFYEQMPVVEEPCTERIVYKTCDLAKKEKTISDVEALKPSPRGRKSDINLTEKKVSTIKQSRDNSYFQNIAFTRPAFTYVVEKGRKEDFQNVAAFNAAEKLEADYDSTYDRQKSDPEKDPKMHINREISEFHNEDKTWDKALPDAGKCTTTTRTESASENLAYEISTQTRRVLERAISSNLLAEEDFVDESCKAVEKRQTSDKAMSPLHSSMLRSETSTQTEVDTESLYACDGWPSNYAQNQRRTKAVKKETNNVQESERDIVVPKKHTISSSRRSTGQDSDMEYMRDNDATSDDDDVFDDAADDELMHRIDKKLHGLRRPKSVSIRSEDVEELIFSDDDSMQMDDSDWKIRATSQDRIDVQCRSHRNEAKEAFLTPRKDIIRGITEGIDRTVKSEPAPNAGKFPKTTLNSQEDNQTTHDGRNQEQFGETAVSGAKLIRGRSRSKVEVKRSTSSIDISIAMSDAEDTVRPSSADEDNWEMFAKAVRDTTETFERKLWELSNRFKRTLDNPNLGFSEEDFLGVPELNYNWDSDCEDEDSGTRALSALEDRTHAPRRRLVKKPDEMRIGASSSLADYRRSDDPISSPQYERPFRYSSRQRDKPEEDDDVSLRVSRQDSHALTRTHSVKQTALERRSYAGSSRSPYRSSYRLTPPLRPRSVDPLGFTRSQYFTYHPSSPIYSSLDTSRDREMISQIDKENLDRRKLTRSLRVENLKPEWRRSTIHTSQPYSPVKNYHRQRGRAMERRSGVHDFPGSYKRSMESLEREAADGDVSGAMALAKYYREPKLVHTIKGNRFSLN